MNQVMFLYKGKGWIRSSFVRYNLYKSIDVLPSAGCIAGMRLVNVKPFKSKLNLLVSNNLSPKRLPKWEL